jgi:hypothetical protein
MWADGAYWLPPILQGRRIQARFTFQGDNESIAEVTIRDLEADLEDD